MHTVARLFDRLVDPDHMERCCRAALRGKRRRPKVAAFELRRERTLRRILDDLRNDRWQPQRPQEIYVRTPKPRVIAWSPIEDRIVQAAVATLCEPIVLRQAEHADFACRRGFGTHRAVLRLQQCMRRYRWVLHLDVRSYFPSINLGVLRGQLAARIRDSRFLAVVDRMLEAGRGFYDDPQRRRRARIDADWPRPGHGVPIGSAFSQLLAVHLYLQDFDHFVKRILHVRGYVRYVDDLYLFDDDRLRLDETRQLVDDYLFGGLDLRLKRPTAPMLACAGSLDALGVRLRRDRIEVLPVTWRRLRADLARRLRDRSAGKAWARGLEASLASRAAQVFFG